MTLMLVLSIIAGSVALAPATASAASSTEYVYTGGNNGDIVKHYAGNGTKVWKKDFGSAVNSMMRTPDGNISVARDKSWAIISPSKTEVLNVSLSSAGRDIVATSSYVYVATGGGNVHKYNYSGGLLWNKSIGNTVQRVAVSASGVYGSTSGGTIYQLDKSDGSEIRNKTLTSGEPARIDYYSGNLYAVDSDGGTIYKLDQDLSTVATTTNIPEPKAGKVSVTGEGVYIYSWDATNGDGYLVKYNHSLSQLTSVGQFQVYGFEATDNAVYRGSASGGETAYKPSDLSSKWSTTYHTSNVNAIAENAEFTGKQSVSGTVVTKSGDTPVANATVKVLGVNKKKLSVDASEYKEKARELMNKVTEVTPPTWDKNYQLTGSDGVLSSSDKAVPLVHTAEDWDQSVYTLQTSIGSAQIDDPQLGDPLINAPAGEPLVLSAWHPDEQPIIPNAVEGDLPGEPKNRNITVTRLGAGGDTLETYNVSPDQTASGATYTYHYGVWKPQPGFYQISVANSPISYTVVVGNPQQLIHAWKANLKNKAQNYAQMAQQLRDYYSDQTMKEWTTTTNASGGWSVSVPRKYVTVSVVAYKGPLAELNKDPKNVTQQDLRNLYTNTDFNGSVILPAEREVVDPPESGVTVSVKETRAPRYLNRTAWTDLLERINSLIANEHYTKAAALIDEQLDRVDSERKKKILRNLLDVAGQSSRLEDKAMNQLQQMPNTSTDVKLDVNVSNLSSAETQQRIQALSQAIGSLQQTLAAEQAKTSASGQTISMRQAFDGDLTSATALIHLSNGTTRSVGLDSKYLSINSNVGNDVLILSDYPIGDAAAARVEFITTSEEGAVGHTSKRVDNPSVDAKPPALAGVDLDTLRPGPDSNVSFTMVPEGGAKYAQLEDLTVYGPSGTQVASGVTGSETGYFKTSGNGTYFVRATYSNLNGHNFTTTFQVVTGNADVAMPPGIRVESSAAAGAYALTGEAFSKGSVNIKSGGSKAIISGTLEDGDEIPGEIHVYTTGTELAPDHTLTVTMLKPDGQVATKDSRTIIHTQELPSDALLYKDGHPLPRDEPSQYGVVNETNGQTVIKTYLSDGDLKLKSNSDPSFIEQAQYWVATNVPEVDVPLVNLGVPYGAMSGDLSAQGAT